MKAMKQMEDITLHPTAGGSDRSGADDFRARLFSARAGPTLMQRAVSAMPPSPDITPPAPAKAKLHGNVTFTARDISKHGGNRLTLSTNNGTLKLKTGIPAAANKKNVHVVPTKIDLTLNTNALGCDYDVELGIMARDNEPGYKEGEGYIRHFIPQNELGTTVKRNLLDRPMTEQTAAFLTQFAGQTAETLDQTYRTGPDDDTVYLKSNSFIKYLYAIHHDDNGVLINEPLQPTSAGHYCLPLETAKAYQKFGAEYLEKNVSYINLDNIWIGLKPAAKTNFKGDTIKTTFDSPFVIGANLNPRSSNYDAEIENRANQQKTVVATLDMEYVLFELPEKK